MYLGRTKVTPVRGPYRPSGKTRLKRRLPGALILCGAMAILVGVALTLAAELLIAGLPLTLIGTAALAAGLILYFIWSEDNIQRR